MGPVKENTTNPKGNSKNPNEVDHFEVKLTTPAEGEDRLGRRGRTLVFKKIECKY